MAYYIIDTAAGGFRFNHRKDAVTAFIMLAAMLGYVFDKEEVSRSLREKSYFVFDEYPFGRFACIREMHEEQVFSP